MLIKRVKDAQQINIFNSHLLQFCKSLSTLTNVSLNAYNVNIPSKERTLQIYKAFKKFNVHLHYALTLCVSRVESLQT